MKKILYMIIVVCFVLVGCGDKYQDTVPQILNEKISSFTYSAKPNNSPSDDLLDGITVTFEFAYRLDGVSNYSVDVNNETEKNFNGALSFEFRRENKDYVGADTIDITDLKPNSSSHRYISCKDAPEFEISYSIEDYEFSDEVVIDETKLEYKFDLQYSSTLQEYFKENFGNTSEPIFHASWYEKIKKYEVFTRKYEDGDAVVSSKATITIDDCSSSNISSIATAALNCLDFYLDSVTLIDENGNEVYSLNNIR